MQILDKIVEKKPRINYNLKKATLNQSDNPQSAKITTIFC